MSFWLCRDRRLPIGERTLVMGVLNVTPDSFSDGGEHLETAAAIARAQQMLAEGADIIDVGGESSRPGADPVPEDVELERVIPVIEAVCAASDAAVSIDTTKSAVAEAALQAGAVIVNDISAMRFDPTMAEVVAAHDAGLVIMHMQGEPRTMQQSPHYDDVVAEVRDALIGWAGEASSKGIAPERIAIDPGIGFGKTLEHNLALLRSLEVLTDTGHPIVVGTSRKSFIGKVLGDEVGERIMGTAASVAWAVAKGANVVRVHDVGDMVKVVRMTEAIREKR